MLIFANALSTLGSGLVCYTLLALPREHSAPRSALLAAALLCLTVSLGIQVPPLLGVQYP